MKAADVIGTWRNIGYEIVAKDGGVTLPFGPGPHHGNLVYHPNGTVSVLVIRTDPQRLAAGRSAEERAAALDRCTGYVGRYELTGELMIHHIENCLNPSWVGTAQQRFATLDGDILVLSPPPDAAGARIRIIWQRMARA